MAEEAFAHLASRCRSAGMKLFKFRPKYHLGMHMAIDMDPAISLNACSHLV